MAIFFIHYLFAEGKKGKEWLGMMFVDGVSTSMDFPSVPRCTLKITYNIMQLSNEK